MYKQIIIAVILLILSSSCTPSSSLEKEAETTKVDLDSELVQLIEEAKRLNSADAYQKLAQYYVRKENTNKAISAYKRALEIDSTRTDIRIEFGGFSYSDGDKIVGLKIFKSILEGDESSNYMDEIASYLFKYAISQITYGPHNSAFPAWSEDGESIYFQTDVNGNWDIAKVPLSGGGVQLVLNSSQNEAHPSVSSDGRFIVYTSDVYDKRTLFDSQKWREIMIYDRRNRISERVTRNYLDDFYPRFTSYSNDLTYISEEVNEAKTKYGERLSYLFSMSDDGSFQIPVIKQGDFFTNSGAKFLNNEKEEIVLYSAKKNGEFFSLFVQNLKTKKERVLFNEKYNMISVDVSNNTKKVLFSSDKYSSLDIMMTNVIGTRVERLTNFEKDEDQAVFSPDGKKVAFHSNKNGQYDIYIINLNSRNAKVTVENLLNKINSELLKKYENN